jgi:hypothetical protein
MLAEAKTVMVWKVKGKRGEERRVKSNDLEKLSRRGAEEQRSSGC